MTTRTLIRSTDVTDVYEIRDDANKLLCVSEEPKTGTPAASLAAITDRMQQALAVNDAFLAIGSPTNAQVSTQVQRLTRECSGLIRLLLSRLDDTAGT